MIITSDQLQRIARAGGGLFLDAAAYPPAQLRDVLSAAGAGEVRITVKNVSGLTASQLEELASLAPGLVVFDLTS
jgi:hypothetical protein